MGLKDRIQELFHSWNAFSNRNGNRKLYKRRHEQKIDAVAAMMDAYIAYRLNQDAFD